MSVSPSPTRESLTEDDPKRRSTKKLWGKGKEKAPSVSVTDLGRTGGSSPRLSHSDVEIDPIKTPSTPEEEGSSGGNDSASASPSMGRKGAIQVRSGSDRLSSRFFKSRRSINASPETPQGTPSSSRKFMLPGRRADRASDSTIEIDDTALLYAGGGLTVASSPVNVSGSIVVGVPTASPKMSTRNPVRKPFSSLLRGRKTNQDSSPFSRQREGQLGISGTRFEGTPVVSGSFVENDAGSSSNTVRLEGIPGGIVRLVCSSENMLGVLSQTGDLYVAASSKLHHSASGQLPESLAQIPQPSQHAGGFRLVRVKGMGPLRKVSLGDYHSAAISEDRRVFTWGMNVNDSRYLTQDPGHGKTIESVIAGQLGHGFLHDRYSAPRAVDGVIGNPLDVAVGSSHTVVLTDEGVYTCGNPMALGRPDTYVFDVLMIVPGLRDIPIAAVACGWDHTLAVVKNSGAVYSWGLNDHGQLGQPRNVKISPEPALVPGSKNVAAVFAGPQHSVCVTSPGFVIVWGSNVYGELGLGQEDDRVFEPQLVGEPLGDEHTVILASCSRNRTVLVTGTGEVFQSGRAITGSGFTRSFVRVPLEAKYVGGVAVGASHVVYLIDQALTHLMAQLVEPRSGSSEAFLRKLLRLFQVAVDNDSAELISGVQSRVNRLTQEQASDSFPRLQIEMSVLRFVLKPGERRASQIVRIGNANPFKIECDCWWGLKNDAWSIKFNPSTFVIEEQDAIFVRIEVSTADDSMSMATLQTLCQLSARRIRKKSGSSGNGFASHFFFVDVLRSESRERDPELVQHLVDTMSTYVPQAILRDLQKTPAPTGPSNVIFPGAVLFIDISGFTALNARLSILGPAGPEQVSTHLNRYFGQLIDAVHRHGGDVLKFAGDALICLFGTPECGEPLKTLVMRAVQCGCEIQRELPEYDSQQGFRLTLHIAVSSGELHWLHLGGVDSHYEHVIMGDPMLQLETAVEASKAGEVVISAESYTLISDCVTAAQRGASNYLIPLVTNPLPVVEQQAIPAVPQMEAGLRCFLPTSVLARIDALHMSWLAELRRVTVIFVNLTSLTYERGQDVPLKDLNDVLCTMQHIVFRYEGMVRQFIVDDKGTVLIAAFGVPPFGHEDDAVRGIKAAWEIHHKLRASSVTCSIGVTTGKVFCGSVGSSKRQEYAMVGDIVNLSARLMVVAKNLRTGIVVDEATRELTDEQVVYEILEPVVVKGRTEPVAIAKPAGLTEQPAVEHTLLQSNDDEKKTTSSMKEITLVGRKAEMGLLQLQVAKLQALKKVSGDARGSTKTFVVSGPAGIGKTRIVNELAKLCRKQNVEYYIGQCDALEKTTPFYVFQTILEQLMNLELWKQRNQKMLKSELHEAMAEHWQSDHKSVGVALGVQEGSNWAEYLPLLNTVLPLGLPENEMCSVLDADKRHMLTVSFMAYLIQTRATEKPVVLIVEDLQWIDASSMELLAAVAAETSANSKGILILLSQRSAPQHLQYKQLLQLTGVEELKLVPLSDEECRMIACSTLGVPLSAWPAQLNKALHKAHGNPLFAMEIAYGLRESGAVTVEGETLVIHRRFRAGTEIPETIEGMIGSRIDQLPAGPQLLLKVASVIGMEFTVSLLEAIYPIENQRGMIVANLKELLEVGLLERAGPGSPVWKFKNDTVRDVTYNRMLFTQRQQLHEKIACYYEKEFRKTGEDRQMALSLAHHWSKALLGSDAAVDADVIIRVAAYVISAATLLRDENVDESARYLSDADQLADMLPESRSIDKETIKAHVKRMLASLNNVRASGTIR